eukprot:gene5348-5884_t
MSLLGGSSQRGLRDVLLFSAGSVTVCLSFAIYSRFFASAGTPSTTTGQRESVSVERVPPSSDSLSELSKNAEQAVPWQPGQPQPMPYPSKVWKAYHPADLKASGGLYGLMISSIVPRPIALVTSQDKEGNLNAAPYSYFNIVCHDPPLVMIGCCINMRAKTKKDTLYNIEGTKQFVVNIMSSWYLEAANHTSGNFPSNVNEMEVAGLASLPSDLVRPPRLAEAAVQLECEAYDIREIRNEKNEHTASMIMGKIVKFHVHESVLVPGGSEAKPVVDWAKLQPVGRLGGETYTVVDNARDISRPVF